MSKGSPELTERMMPEETKKISETELAMLDEDVILLHNIARRVETLVGRGQLSDDIRHAADRLHSILKRH